MDDCRIDELLEVLVIGVAHDLRGRVGLIGGAVVDGIADIDIVVAGALKQFGMQRQAEQAFVLRAGIDIGRASAAIAGPAGRDRCG